VTVDLSTWTWIVNRIRQRWLWAVIAALSAAAVALAASLILPPRYHATARIAVLRTGSTVRLDERFTSYSEETWLDERGFDYLTRQKTVLELGQASEVETAVVGRLADQLDPAEMRPGQLSNRVAVAANPGEVIRVTAQADTSEQAAVLANVWAEELQRHVNGLLSSVPLSPTLTARQLTDAEEAYETAERNYADLLRGSRREELTTALNRLRTNLARYLEIADAIDGALNRARMLKQLAVQAEPDWTQVHSIKESMFLLILELSALEIPEFVSVGPEAPSVLDQTGDTLFEELNGLLQALEAWNTEVAWQLSDQDTFDEIRQLTHQIELEDAQIGQLVEERDVAWDTLQLLRSKSRETLLTAGNPDSTVVLASRAAPPERPTWPNRLLLVVVGVLAGASAGLALALLLPERDRKGRTS